MVGWIAHGASFCSVYPVGQAYSSDPQASKEIHLKTIQKR